MALLGVVGCDAVTGPKIDRLPGIQTEGASFHFSGEYEYRSVEIPYTFTNRTGAPVYIVNCRGAFGVQLERWEQETWKAVWSPVLLACLGAPIVIEAGESRPYTLKVSAGEFGSNYHPQFDRPDPSGTYRIVWTDALSSFQDRLPFGGQIPLEHRVSNEFQLVFE